MPFPAMWSSWFLSFFEVCEVAGLVTCVTANNGFPRSIIHLCLRTQRTLTFVTSLHQAFWRRRWQSWGSPYNQTHHWSWLCCESFFTWIFLCSFRHHIRTLCRTEMANVEQTQKMIPFIACEVSLGQYVCELVFGVNVFDLDLWVQIYPVEQPVKSNSVGPGYMSHRWTSSLDYHFWSLLRCLQTHTPKLPGEKNWTCEGKNQHCPDHQSFPFRHFRTLCEQTVDNPPADSFSSSRNWWSSMHGVATLFHCWAVSFASSQHLSTHFFAWPSISKDHKEMFALIFQSRVAFSVSPTEILESNIFLYLSTKSLLIWHSLWVQPK